MNRVSIYLNFAGDAEAAFTRYAEVFGGELTQLQRMREMPADPNRPPLPENEQDMLVHVELAIIDGTVLMGTDMLDSMGQVLRIGNNTTMNLEIEDLAETTRLFDALSDGGTDVFGLERMFWGAYWGTCCDRFGVRWMFNCPVESD